MFISSTVEDLKAYRKAAQDAALSAGFQPILFEHWPAKDQRRPVAECLSHVSQADLLVVIVAHRYGWVPGPPDQPPDEHKNITWMECEHAHGENKEVLAFLVDKDAAWPVDFKDSHTLSVAVEEGKCTEELVRRVERDIAGLRQFKRWLDDGRLRVHFRNVDEFEGKLGIALRDWRDRHPEFKPPPVPPGDPHKYLEALREQTGWINIRGLMVGSGKAQRFPIDQLYIPLTTASGLTEANEAPELEGVRPSRAARRERVEGSGNRERVELEDLLSYRRLVIVGDPGAGKTTFLWRIAFELSNAWLKKEAAPFETPLSLASETSGRGREAPASFFARLAAALRRPFAGEPGRASPHRQSPGARTSATAPNAPRAQQDAPSFPIFVRIAELSEHIRRRLAQPGYEGPTTDDNPAWLIDFLTDQNRSNEWGLDEAFFKEKLKDGAAILLLDGLDEPPGTVEREAMARLFEKATRAHELCRFVVTTRPLAYVGNAVLEGAVAAALRSGQPLAVRIGAYRDHPSAAKRSGSGSAVTFSLGRTRRRSHEERSGAQVRRNFCGVGREQRLRHASPGSGISLASGNRDARQYASS